MLNVQKLLMCSLTRSSSAVRLGVLTGAWGTLGSLPRLGGKGSRGKPLHISFKEDIPPSINSHTLEQRPGDRDWKAALALTALRGFEGDHSLSYCLIGSLVVFALRSPPMIRRGQKRVFGNYWSLRIFEVVHASEDKQSHRPLTPDAQTCNSVKQEC